MVRRLKKTAEKILITAFLSVLALLFISPLAITITNSFMSEPEILANYGMIGTNADNAAYSGISGYANLKLIPDMVTFRQYYTILIKRSQYLFMFWNSAGIVLPILLGQLLIASMAAYAFSRLKFRGRGRLFYFYMVVMLMPFQVTLVPNYLVAQKLGLVGNTLSIILPGIFGTFGVFLLRQFMTSIPEAYAEAAVVEGAGHWTVFSRIIMPMSANGIGALIILVFIDHWNMVEQPLVFLPDIYQQPLSVFLSSINEGERGLAFAASALYMAPMLLVFLYGEDYLVEGIRSGGLKG